MSRKDDRIKALEEANAVLVADKVRLIKENAELRSILDQHENGRVAQQSLGDRVRSEFHERWGWLGDLVGL